MLEIIKDPKDIKGLEYPVLEELANEIREDIIDTVSKNGGHLASNLGIVEATLALHRVFNAPEDKIIFDVSHQSYAHKLLTGRYKAFSSLRKNGGLSGFTNICESEYDTVTAGHSGTSISTALGYAQSAKLLGKDSWAVAVIGDGSFTNGMAYEALNNCGEEALKLIILLNDNEMSISQNVGGMHHSLSTIRTSKSYFKFKRGIKKVFIAVPFVGKYFVDFAIAIRDIIKRVFTKYNIFESLGCDYIGPVDGNDIRRLEDALLEAKTKNRCCVVHMITKKGKGYAPAEEHPEHYHSVAPFDKKSGAAHQNKTDFSSEFGKYMCELAKNDKRVCAVTAAMIDGTGLTEFEKRFPDRLFDTAISEEHATTFTSALAKAGMKPVLALYSTFSQRIYDQVSHDAALQGSPLVIALDRAGIVGADGVTHQGIFDYSLFSGIPSVNIYSPETYCEMRNALDAAMAGSSPSIVRYPRGAETEYDRSGYAEFDDMCVKGSKTPDAVIITYGRITKNADAAAEMLTKLGISVRVIKLIRICPLPLDRIFKLTEGAKLIYLLEEGIKAGSVSEKIACEAALRSVDPKIMIKAICDTFVPHGEVDDLFAQYGLDATSAARDIYDYLHTVESKHIKRGV